MHRLHLAQAAERVDEHGREHTTTATTAGAGSVDVVPNIVLSAGASATIGMTDSAAAVGDSRRPPSGCAPRRSPTDDHPAPARPPRARTRTPSPAPASAAASPIAEGSGSRYCSTIAVRLRSRYGPTPGATTRPARAAERGRAPCTRSPPSGRDGVAAARGGRRRATGPAAPVRDAPAVQRLAHRGDGREERGVLPQSLPALVPGIRTGTTAAIRPGRGDMTTTRSTGTPPRRSSA